METNNGTYCDFDISKKFELLAYKHIQNNSKLLHKIEREIHLHLFGADKRIYEDGCFYCFLQIRGEYFKYLESKENNFNNQQLVKNKQAGKCRWIKNRFGSMVCLITKRFKKLTLKILSSSY